MAHKIKCDDMKNALQFYYNIGVEKLQQENDSTYSFYIDYDKFYFTVVNRPLEDLMEIYKITNMYPKNFHTIVKNRQDQLTTEVDGQPYILLKIRGPENIEVDMIDMIKGEISYKVDRSLLNRTNWSELWSNKVDYLEYQISELGTTHETVRKSFSYYVGLAENAISYFNLLKTDGVDTVISHRRIKCPNINSNFENPLDIVIDYRARDYGEYLKAQFFANQDAIAEVKLLIEKKPLTPLEYNLLFCRLLYPSYYFDSMTDILEHNEQDDILLKYIEKVDEYEKFLNEVYRLFSKFASMIKIDWLIKKS